MTDDKQRLRKTTIAARNALTPDEMARLSQEIAERFWQLPETKASHTVMVYLDFGSEVRTDHLIRLAGKREIVVPQTMVEERRLIPARLVDIDDTVLGPYGIRQPKTLEYVRQETIEVIAVPGVAYDRDCNRIGYGGGYYDRFLSDLCAVKIGLAFECQLVNRIPVNEHDVPVDLVLTERNTFRRIQRN